MITPVHGSARYAVIHTRGGPAVAAVHGVHVDAYLARRLLVSIRQDGINNLPPWYEAPIWVEQEDIACLVSTSEAATKHLRDITKEVER